MFTQVWLIKKNDSYFLLFQIFRHPGTYSRKNITSTSIWKSSILGSLHSLKLDLSSTNLIVFHFYTLASRASLVNWTQTGTNCLTTGVYKFKLGAFRLYLVGFGRLDLTPSTKLSEISRLWFATPVFDGSLNLPCTRLYV